jgi:hypothetical protein
MRELPDATVRDQAEAFLSHRERLPDVVNTARLFQWWSASKGLTPADAEAIRRAAQALMAERVA